MEKIRNLIKKSPEVAIIISAISGFMLSTILHASQIFDFVVKLKREPIVNMHVSTGIINNMTVEIPVNNIVKIPKKYANSKNPPMMTWRTIPIKAEFINPRHESMVYRDLKLIFLEEKQKNSNACKDPYYFPKDRMSGFYTFLVQNKLLNPDNEINTPITIPSNEAKTYNIDFLTDAFIKGEVRSANTADFKKYTSYCLRWEDQNGNLYLSNTYHPLEYR